jgi:hypothetical protein
MRGLIFYALIIFYFSAAAQKITDEKMFSDDLLLYPRQHKQQISTIFAYNEISRFPNKTTPGKVILENGYASAQIRNPELWTKMKAGKKEKEIDIVFTKYPRKKGDWITNYDDLLSDRLRELFQLDPSLNRKDIKYQLVLQTDCRTDQETRIFFHGIVICTDELKKETGQEKSSTLSEKNTTDKKSVLQDSLPVVNSNNRNFSEQEYFNNNSFINREVQNKKPVKKKMKDLACPDFTKKKIIR